MLVVNKLSAFMKIATALLEKDRGISPVLTVCPILDALITRIPADEEPLYGEDALTHIYRAELACYLWPNPDLSSAVNC